MGLYISIGVNHLKVDIDLLLKVDSLVLFWMKFSVSSLYSYFIYGRIGILSVTGKG